MTTAGQGTEAGLTPVKFSRLSKRGVLLGLSGSQLVVVGFGAAVLVFSLYLGGGIILGVSENIGSVFFPSAFRDAYGLVFLIAILLVRPSGLFGDKS